MSPDVSDGHRSAARGLAFMAFAHSEETALRHPGCACFLRRLHDTGNPERARFRRGDAEGAVRVAYSSRCSCDVLVRLPFAARLPNVTCSVGTNVLFRAGQFYFSDDSREGSSATAERLVTQVGRRGRKPPGFLPRRLFCFQRGRDRHTAGALAVDETPCGRVGPRHASRVSLIFRAQQCAQL